MEKTLSRSHVRAFLVAAVILASLMGCMTVRLIAEYDQQFDQDLTAFQKALDAHLNRVERAIGTGDADYASFVSFYDEARASLNGMKMRAAATPKNDFTIEQVALLIENFGHLEDLHKGGLKANDIPPMRTAFGLNVEAILKLDLAKMRGES